MGRALTLHVIIASCKMLCGRFSLRARITLQVASQQQIETKLTDGALKVFPVVSKKGEFMEALKVK